MELTEREARKIELLSVKDPILNAVGEKSIWSLKQRLASSPMEIRIDDALACAIESRTGRKLEVYVASGFIVKRGDAYYVDPNALFADEPRPARKTNAPKPHYKGRLTKEVLMALVDPWPLCAPGMSAYAPAQLLKHSFKNGSRCEGGFDQVSPEHHAESYAAFQAGGYVKPGGEVDTDKLWYDLKQAGLIQKGTGHDVLAPSVANMLEALRCYVRSSPEERAEWDVVPGYVIGRDTQFDADGLFIPQEPEPELETKKAGPRGPRR